MTEVQMNEFSDDLLRGAKAIAKFLFGDEKYSRRVFHLHATGRLPTFTMGTAVICARKSTLLAYFEEQERRKRTQMAMSGDASRSVRNRRDLRF